MFSESARTQLWRLFFAINVPIALFVDCVELYPQHLVPKVLTDLHEFYLTTFNDQLYLRSNNLWFMSFGIVELLYQAPICAWLYFALGKNDSRAPLHGFAYGLIGAITTLPCLVEMYYDNVMTSQQKVTLMPFYITYQVIFLLLTFDMGARINSRLIASGKTTKKTQ